MSLTWRVAGTFYRQGAKGANEETKFLGVLGALAVDIPARAA